MIGKSLKYNIYRFNKKKIKFNTLIFYRNYFLNKFFKFLLKNGLKMKVESVLLKSFCGIKINLLKSSSYISSPSRRYSKYKSIRSKLPVFNKLQYNYFFSSYLFIKDYKQFLHNSKIVEYKTSKFIIDVLNYNQELFVNFKFNKKT